jgi:hypothetical protein
MKTLALVSQKGGSGKTALAITPDALAVAIRPSIRAEIATLKPPQVAANIPLLNGPA